MKEKLKECMFAESRREEYLEADMDQREECSKVGEKVGGTGKCMVMYMCENAMRKTSPWSAFKVIKNLTTKIIN